MSAGVTHSDGAAPYYFVPAPSRYPLQAGASLLVTIVVAGCASCQSCKSLPGWDGRYATHDAGSLNRENRRGLTQ